MIILEKHQRDDLIAFIPGIRINIAAWKLVEFRLSEDAVAAQYSIQSAVEQVYATYKKNDGVIFICNDHELLILLRTGEEKTYQTVAKEITSSLPENTCEVFVHSADKEFGLQKLEFVLIKPPLLSGAAPQGHGNISDNVAYIEPTESFPQRSQREETIALIVDDDMFIRKMLHKALEGLCDTIVETDDGEKVAEMYQRYNPDLVLLDIHIPNKDGKHILENLLDEDPKAYIVMISSDTATDQVVSCLQAGAMGFIEKPASKEKLEEYISKCPTIAA